MPGRELNLLLPGVQLGGELAIPQGATGLVIFAHGSGSSRHSPRNQYVAGVLRDAGLGTLLFDLLTRQEEIEEAQTRHLRFDITLLARRLSGATRWVLAEGALPPGIAIGFFGSSTGAAAALVAAAELSDKVVAVVSRGGRPDLAGDLLGQVEAATLLIVGGSDVPVISLNEAAYARLACEKVLQIVPGASHLFEEPGALEMVARMASAWFVRHLRPTSSGHG